MRRQRRGQYGWRNGSTQSICYALGQGLVIQPLSTGEEMYLEGRGLRLGADTLPEQKGRDIAWAAYFQAVTQSRDSLQK